MPDGNLSTSTGCVCPLCGSDRPRPALKVILEENCVYIGDVRIRLRPQEAELMHILGTRYPGGGTYSLLIDGLWGALGGPPNAVPNIRVMASRIRSKLRPHGWNLRTVDRRSLVLEQWPA